MRVIVCDYMSIAVVYNSNRLLTERTSVIDVNTSETPTRT